MLIGCIMKMEKGLDTGDMILKKEVVLVVAVFLAIISMFFENSYSDW